MKKRKGRPPKSQQNTKKVQEESNQVQNNRLTTRLFLNSTSTKRKINDELVNTRVLRPRNK